MTERARVRGGARALRPVYRHARGLGGTLGLTLLGALLPGSVVWWTGRRLLGGLLLLLTLGVLVLAGGYVARDPRAVVDLAFDPVRLQATAGLLAVGLAVWSVVVLLSHRMVRPVRRTAGQTLAGNAFVALLCLAVAAPVTVGARYAMVQADLVETVFEDNRSATVPTDVTEADPWAGRKRVNLLLLGGDGGVDRYGVRTDTVILVSMDTRTGRTVMFSLPRNMMYAQFPPGSPLHELYPHGFTGAGDPASWMLNAVYGQVPALHPGVLGRSDNEGADATKQAVAGSLGIPVHYYLLVNLLGFRRIVDAMGGVTVNINEPIAIGGKTDLGVPPDGYLQPGPNQHLDGFEALWYARGRYGSDDYERMERQRCMIAAIIDRAKPLNLLRRYQALAAAGKEIVRTDIPSELLPAFVDLALKVKEAKVRSVVFRSSERFYSGDPDYRWMRQVVRKALAPPPARDPRVPGEGRVPSPAASPSAEPEPGEAQETGDSCAYRPQG